MAKDMRHIGADPIVTKVQENVSQALQPLINSALSNGVLLKSVVIDGDTDVNHKLGRAPQGWIIVRKRANVDVWDKQDTNLKPKLTLLLTSSAAVTIDLWIY